jgi:UDP-N-acetylglucosamine--N-acetylmuramyl-(pentapeptide) pyrophosphoryl-undecaprenol N-acetylglucosamine transferase
MKIVLAGGGSGGHFYPLVAVTEAIRDLASDQKILQPKVYYIAPNPYNAGILFDMEIEYIKIHCGARVRRYFSIKNIYDIMLTAWGFVEAFFKVFFIFPDVIFSKGGLMSLPVVYAGRILRIPIVIHEGDSYPGRANLKAGKFARRIAVSFAEAGQFFDEKKVAHTGNPLRKEIMIPATSGAREYLGLEPEPPVLFIMGGSLGSEKINNVIMDALPNLVEKFEIIHQTGKLNFVDVKGEASVILENSNFKHRYHCFDYLNPLAMRMTAGVASIVISRGGSTIFEIAAWGIPSILIPISDSNGDHQRKNSYNYARSGGAFVIEENNLTPEILQIELNDILKDTNRFQRMKQGALSFAKPDASKKVAEVILNIALTHEK